MHEARKPSRREKQCISSGKDPPAAFSDLFRRGLFREIAKELSLERKSIPPPQFSASLQYFYECPAKHSTSFFRLYRRSPLAGCSRRDSEKTPRWQPRGHDTQFFRPLVQEEEVSSRASVLVRRLRVNSILSAAACYQLTR